MSIPIDKTLDDVRSDLFSRISQVQQDGWLPEALNLNRGPARGLIELWAWGLYQLYQFLMLILKQAFPSTATGLWLEAHGKQVSITRLAASKARGMVFFTRISGGGNVVIPSGRIVKTRPDGMGNVYRFVTRHNAVLPNGATEVMVAVESEEYGAGANVATGGICEIATVIPGIDGVFNAPDWLVREGVDQETDAALRQRYTLAWTGIGGATKHAYESWAREATGVVAVRVMDQHPRGQGTVDVVIRGAAGLPSASLIEQVAGIVESRRPINDNVLVKGPAPVMVDIAAELEITSGNEAAIIAEVKHRWQAMFLDPSTVAGVEPLQIGADLPLDRLIKEAMVVVGIKKINWPQAAVDIEVGADGLAVLQSLTVSTVWASEI